MRRCVIQSEVETYCSILHIIHTYTYKQYIPPNTQAILYLRRDLPVGDIKLVLADFTSST